MEFRPRSLLLDSVQSNKSYDSPVFLDTANHVTHCSKPSEARYYERFNRVDRANESLERKSYRLRKSLCYSRDSVTS